MTWETLLFEVDAGIGVITLNRPSRLNAINMTLQRELIDVFNQSQNEESVRTLVVTGGLKCFSVGADIKDLDGLKLLPAFLAQGIKLAHCVETFGKPVIAAICGPALAGGLELALCCDIRIASDDSTLGLPEITLGALPAGGGTQRLPRLIGPAQAKQLIFTGEPISAAEAYRIGLVNTVAPRHVCLTTAMELARKIAERPPLALREAKSCINAALQVDLETGLNLEVQSAEYLATTEDQKEAFRSFVDKRRPEFKGR